LLKCKNGRLLTVDGRNLAPVDRPYFCGGSEKDVGEIVESVAS